MRRYALVVVTEEERALFILINALMVITGWDCMETLGYQLLTMDNHVLNHNSAAVSPLIKSQLLQNCCYLCFMLNYCINVAVSLNTSYILLY
jgi:hypothetical protein